MKVLMVCLGNICRSPMAQGILESKVSELGLVVEVDSAGTSNYHIGDPPDPRSIAKMREYGIDITSYRGRQFNESDFEAFDRIFAMDVSNFNNMRMITENTAKKDKVELILNLADPNSNMSVPDPYYGGEDGFENVYRLLDVACDKLIEEIKREQA